MNTTNIELSDSGINAILSLQHPNGTYPYYSRILKRVFDVFLHESEELSLSNDEVMDILRGLDWIVKDLKALAGQAFAKGKSTSELDPDEIRRIVEESFGTVEESEADEDQEDDKTPGDGPERDE